MFLPCDLSDRSPLEMAGVLRRHLDPEAVPTQHCGYCETSRYVEEI